jgi:hypothetical protein
MKLSSGKLQFWECNEPPVDAGTFCSLSNVHTGILHVLMLEDSVKASK